MKWAKINLMTPKSSLSRRQFLKIIAIGGAAAALALRFDENWLDNLIKDTGVIHETRFLMGTVVNLTLVCGDPSQASMAAAAALAEMQRLERIYSRFDPSGQLARLNAQGVLRSPDPSLVTLLQQAHSLSQVSQGAFDVSIKPLLDLYERFSKYRLPSRAAIRETLKKVDYKNVMIDTNEIGFSLPGMSLTLDGIAKGAVIDGGVHRLRDHGFDNVIVEAGGDLLASGSHGPGTPWKIGLRSPRQDTTFTTPKLQGQNMAVATSGDYLQPFADDYSVHHILDPRQGISSPELASATVVAPSAVLADSLATGIMVAGVQAGLDMLKQFPGCEAYLITKDLQSTASPGMTSYLV